MGTPNDVGLFGVGSTVPTRWNEYFAGPSDIRLITGETASTSQAPGHVVCRHGITSLFDCGAIQRTELTIQIPNAPRYLRVTEVRLASAPGDSGAGFIRTLQNPVRYVAYGILSGGATRNGVAYTYYYPTSFDITGGDTGTIRYHPCATTTCP